MYYLNDNLKIEISHFYHYIKTIFSDVDYYGAIAKPLYEQNLIDIFPNVLRLYFTIDLTNCETECSFSKLTVIKNQLRSTQFDDRLNALTIMLIVSNIHKNLFFYNDMKTFVPSKSRKKYFN